MYYKEGWIKGVLMYKLIPEGEWKPVSKENLTKRIIERESEVVMLQDKVEELQMKIDSLEERLED